MIVIIIWNLLTVFFSCIGGYKSNEDAETIRTEDFVEKFQDTLVYSSGMPTFTVVTKKHIL